MYNIINVTQKSEFYCNKVYEINDENTYNKFAYNL